jgi:hypothetical protein
MKMLFTWNGPEPEQPLCYGGADRSTGITSARNSLSASRGEVLLP